MKRLAILAALLSTTAYGADLPAKPKALAGIVPVCGSGIYLGVNTMGAAGAVANSPVAGESIVQGEIGVTVGYTGTFGPCVPGVASPFWAVEGRFDLTNLNGSSAPGLSLSGPVHLQQRLLYGNPAITQMLGSIPGLGAFSTPSLPVLPSGVTVTTTIPYIGIAVNEQDVSAQLVMSDGTTFATNKVWEVTPEFQVGMWNRLSNTVVVDVHAGYQIQSQGICFGSSSLCPAIGNRWTAGVSFDF